MIQNEQEHAEKETGRNGWIRWEDELNFQTIEQSLENNEFPFSFTKVRRWQDEDSCTKQLTNDMQHRPQMQDEKAPLEQTNAVFPEMSLQDNELRPKQDHNHMYHTFLTFTFSWLLE